MKYMFALAVLVAFVAHASALKCYSCTYDSDKDCVGEGVDTGTIGSANDPDGDIFEYCYKASYDSDKKGVRTGIDDDLLDDVEDAYSVKNGECKSGQDYTDGSELFDDASICVCDSDYCNGSGALTVSFATLFMAAIAKYLC